MQPDDRKRLALESARGKRVKAFMESPFFNDDFLPWLSEYQKTVKAGTLWRPGNVPEIEAVALGCAYQGGKDQACNDIATQLTLWVKLGEEAAAKLEEGHED